MKNTKLNAASVVLQVFETMAFMSGVNLEGQEIPKALNQGFGAKISFSGPASGELHLWAPFELLQSVAELLGVGDDEEAATDTLNEIANVVAGQLLTEIGDAALAFDLGIPIVEKAKDGVWFETPGSDDLLVIDVEDHPVIVLFSIH